ncbi:MAG: ribokinase [Bacillota bacterium]|jgi:ribokinase|nr:ribokinase [Bacillota bacterium]
MQRTKILVIGSLNVDLVIQGPRLPEEGETIMATSFRRYFGGKGANQAVAAARQGADIIMAGRVGADNFGEEQVASLAAEGIDTTYVLMDDEHSSGVAFILVGARGNNRIMVVAGANGAVGPTDIEALVPVMAACSCVLIQLEIPLDAALAAIRLANAQGAKVILDPAPAQSLPLSAYPHITVITPNAHEAQVLTGVPVHDLASAKEAAQILLDRGALAVVITLGSQGVYGLTLAGEFHYPAFEVNAVDTVAAGDTFAGVLAAQIGAGRSLKDAAEYANAAAALAVTRHGAQSSIPTRGEVLQFLGQ